MYLNKILIGIIILILIVMSMLFVKISYMNKTIAKQSNEILIRTQNEVALADRLKMKSDSIQIYALHVKTLQNHITADENIYVVLEGKYELLLKELSDTNVVVPNYQDTSVIQVNFKGKLEKINYDGNTKYFKKDSTSNYTIKINVDPVHIKSIIYLDSADILKNNLYADGVFINNAELDIDSSVFLKLKDKKIDIVPVESFWGKFKLLADIKYPISNKLNLNDFVVGVGAKYKFCEDFNVSVVKYLNDNSKYWIKAEYSKSLKEISMLLFKNK